MTDSNTQPYTGYDPRTYEGYKLEKQNITEPGEILESYRIKVWDISKVKISSTVDFSKSIYKDMEDYKTPIYKTTEQAFAHAYGWVDRMRHNKTNPNEIEDLWKNDYDKLKKHQAEFYRYQKKDDIQGEKQLQEAYKKGWQLI